MGLFSRKDGAPRPDDVPAHDPFLPVSHTDGVVLRDLARLAFAECGLEVTVVTDHVQGPGGRTFGLLPVVDACFEASTDDWPELVRKQVHAALEPSPGLDGVGEVELNAHVVARLLGEPLVPDRSWFPGADRMADDLIVVPALDLGEEALVVAESEYASRGDLEHWHERSLLNLHRLVRESPLEASYLKGQHVEIDVVRGTSAFTASFTIFLPELLDRFGLAEGDRGVLVVVPSRHQLAFRVVDGTRTTIRAIDDLFAFGILGYRDGTDPISPHVYWVEDGAWTRITDYVDGQPVVVPKGAAVGALGIDQRR